MLYELGIEIAVIWIECGTLVKSTMAKLGDEVLTITWVLGKLETAENGTITGETHVETMATGDENHESGTAVTDGGEV